MKNFRYHVVSGGKVVATSPTGGGAMKAIYTLQYAKHIPPAKRIPLDQPIFIREQCVCGGNDHVPWQARFYDAAGDRISDPATVPDAERYAPLKPAPEVGP